MEPALPVRGMHGSQRYSQNYEATARGLLKTFLMIPIAKIASSYPTRDGRHILACDLILTMSLDICHDVTSRHVTSRHVTSCHVASPHAMSRYVALCHVISLHLTSCHVMSRLVTSRHVTSCRVTSHHVASCRVMSRLVTFCYVM